MKVTDTQEQDSDARLEMWDEIEDAQSAIFATGALSATDVEVERAVALWIIDKDEIDDVDSGGWDVISSDTKDGIRTINIKSDRGHEGTIRVVPIQ